MPLLKASLTPIVVGVVWFAATVGVIQYVKKDIQLITAGAVSNALATLDPAIKWKSVTVKTPTVKINTSLSVEYTAEIRHRCPADLRAFLIDSNGAAAYRFPDTMGGYTPAKKDVDAVIPVSVFIQDPPPPHTQFAPLKPGRYCYRVTAIRYCELIQLDSGVPDACFDLVR